MSSPLPALDPVRLKEAYLDDPELIAEVGALFVASSRERAASLADAVARGDREATSRLAHALRGSASNVGAPRVAGLAARIEASHDDRDALREVLPALLDEIEAVRQELARRAGSR